MASKLTSTKRSPRIKPCKPRGVPSGGTGRGARPTRLDRGAKVRMGKGLFDSFAPIGSVNHK